MPFGFFLDKLYTFYMRSEGFARGVPSATRRWRRHRYSPHVKDITGIGCPNSLKLLLLLLLLLLTTNY